MTPDETLLLERLVDRLTDVEKDTHYGLHDNDYVSAFGQSGYDKDPCQCALCDGRKYLAERK